MCGRLSTRKGLLKPVDEGLGFKGLHRKRTILRACETTKKSLSRFERIFRWANSTRRLPPVTTTPTTGIFRRSCTHRSAEKLLARILDKTVGLPQTSRTVFWSGSTSPQGRPYSMLPAEQEVRRCASRPPPLQVEPGNQWLD